MDFFRQYVLLLLIGIILFSVVIIFIFFLINRCISKSGKHKISHLVKGSLIKTESNKYHEKNPEVVIPPLPPRTQFLTAGAQSYENLADGSDYEQCTADYEQSTDQQLDYVKVEAEEEVFPAPPSSGHPHPNMKGGVSEAQSYENLADGSDYEQCTADYEQSTDQQPDYMKVEEEIFPPHLDPNMKGGISEGQSYENLAEEPDYEQSLDEQPDYVEVEDEDEAEKFLPHPADPEADNCSTDDYDDIGEDQGEEDYDDVG